jgi:hypothetical protein
MQLDRASLGSTRNGRRTLGSVGAWSGGVRTLSTDGPTRPCPRGLGVDQQHARAFPSLGPGSARPARPRYSQEEAPAAPARVPHVHGCAREAALQCRGRSVRLRPRAGKPGVDRVGNGRRRRRRRRQLWWLPLRRRLLDSLDHRALLRLPLALLRRRGLLGSGHSRRRPWPRDVRHRAGSSYFPTTFSPPPPPLYSPAGNGVHLFPIPALSISCSQSRTQSLCSLRTLLAPLRTTPLDRRATPTSHLTLHTSHLTHLTPHTSLAPLRAPSASGAAMPGPRPLRSPARRAGGSGRR